MYGIINANLYNLYNCIYKNIICLKYIYNIFKQLINNYLRFIYDLLRSIFWKWECIA